MRPVPRVGEYAVPVELVQQGVGDVGVRAVPGRAGDHLGAAVRAVERVQDRIGRPGRDVDEQGVLAGQPELQGDLARLRGTAEDQTARPDDRSLR